MRDRVLIGAIPRLFVILLLFFFPRNWLFRFGHYCDYLAEFKLEAATTAHQSDDQQQNDGANCGIDDFRGESGAEVKAEAWEKKASQERTDDTDNDITNDAESSTAYDLARQPTCD